MAEVQPPILLVKMSNKSVNVDLVMKNSEKLVQENLVKEWNKGVVNFDVKMVVRVRFEAGIWLSKKKILCVYFLFKLVNLEKCDFSTSLSLLYTIGFNTHHKVSIICKNILNSLFCFSGIILCFE
jgi:hypothetical protein